MSADWLVLAERQLGGHVPESFVGIGPYPLFGTQRKVTKPRDWYLVTVWTQMQTLVP